jgi:plastocyanin
MQRRWVRGLVAASLLAAVVAGCGDDSDDTSTKTTDGGTEVKAQDIDVTAVDYAFSKAPTEIDAGLVTMHFQNDGKVDHEAALVEIGDTPLDQFLPTFVPAVTGGGPWPAEAKRVAAPVETGAGDSATVTFAVTEGTYALLCTLTGDASNPDAEESQETDPATIHFNKGMAQVLEVGPGGAADLPKADGTITAHDYTFDVDVSADTSTVNFVNTGSEDQVHFGTISEFPEGTSEADALAAFAGAFSSEGGPPPEGAIQPSDDDFGFTGVFSKGLGSHLTISKRFKSGHTYVIACFISDRTGGPPHALPAEAGGHGMVKAFTVT